MGLHKFWHDNKVLIVMGTSLGLIHWGWYNLKSSPLLRPEKKDHIPEPGIVAMKPPSWIRRNWLLAAGGAFVSIHIGVWLMQRAARSSAHSEMTLRQKTVEDRQD